MPAKRKAALPEAPPEPYFVPGQAYVVVDVETTGGYGLFNRVTEIGAVRLVDGQMVDEWSTLVNPEQPIPAGITQMTGISNAMVKDAPCFHEVVDRFNAFMRGAVFVAHNVGFDYNVLAGEYVRLGLIFEYPRLCTVAGMRRYFPGHGSYALKLICREYGIRLKTHHRALCDAKAASELLLLVQQSHIEQMQQT